MKPQLLEDLSRIPPTDPRFGEIWMPVIGYEGWYEISNFGDVRRIAKSRGAVVGRVIAQTFNKYRGYYSVSLHKRRKTKRVAIHILLMETFVGKRPEGYTINHKDGNKINNKLENLEYCTKSENSYHACLFGLSDCKLNEWQRRIIKRCRHIRGSSIIFSKAWNIGVEAVRRVWRNETWSGVNKWQ